jgi:hypothetical protein
MKQSRTLLLVLSAGAVTLLLWLGLQLMQDGPDAAESGEVLTASEAVPENRTQLPGHEDLAQLRAPGLIETPEDEPASTDEQEPGPEDYPRRIVTGRVVIADGGPIPTGLQLSATRSQPSPEITSLSNEMGGGGGTSWYPQPGYRLKRERFAELTLTEVAADGSYEMHNVPTSGAFVKVHHEHLYADPVVRLEGSGTEAVEVLLERGGRILGLVTDPDDAPIDDFEVTVTSNFDPWMIFDTEARMITVEDILPLGEGRFDVRQIPTGTALVLVVKDEDERWQPRQVDLTPLEPGEERSLEVALELGASISGVVVDADDQPMDNARVGLKRLDLSLTNINATAGTMIGNTNRTDELGRFTFSGLSDGAYSVMLREKGFRRVKSERLDVLGGDVVTDVQLLAEAGLVLTGRVHDEQDRPVERASVRASRKRSMMDWTGAIDAVYDPSTRTDEDGLFELGGFDAGELELRVTSKGFESVKLDVKAGQLDIDVQVKALAGLSGVVVSLSDGEPVPSFIVSLTPEKGLFNLADPLGMGDAMRDSKRPQTFNDREDGSFEITDVAPGMYDVLVSGEQFAPTTLRRIEIGPKGRKGLVVMLPPESVITGMVIDGRSGAPIQGAAIDTARGGILSTLTSRMQGGGSQTLTDAEGRFRLAGLGNQPISPSVKHDEFREYAIPSLTLATGEVRDIGLIRLSKGGTIYGTARDALGLGEAGVMVMVSDQTGSTMKRTTTDATGAFRIEGLAPGTYNVMRMDFTMDLGGGGNPMDFMKDMVFSTATIETDEERRVDLNRKTGSGTRIHGVVRSLDGPAAGAMVTVTPTRGGVTGMAFSGTDAEGHYEMTVSDPGDYVFTVIVMGEGMGAGGQPSSPVTDEITVGGSPELRHDVLLTGGTMHGVVESANDGKRLAGVRVLLERTDEGRATAGYQGLMGGRVGEVYTNEQGEFDFRYVPSGTYSVVAGGRNMLDLGLAGWAVTRLDDVRVVEDASGFTVRVRVQPAGEISGIVSDVAGQPLAGVGVWAMDSRGVWMSTFSELSTDVGGAYVMDSLDKGSWTLAFRDGTHGLKLVSGVNVRIGEVTTLDVTLLPGIKLELVLGGHDPGGLDITLIGPGGPVPIDLFALVELLGLSDLTTIKSLGTLEPGLYHLTVTEGGSLLLDTDLTLTLSTGGTAQIQLTP